MQNVLVMMSPEIHTSEDWSLQSTNKITTINGYKVTYTVTTFQVMCVATYDYKMHKSTVHNLSKLSVWIVWLAV